MLTPKEIGVGIAAPTPIEHSAILENGYSSTGAVATDCTIAVGFKPTFPDVAKTLCDSTNHYIMTIQKDDTVVKVWANGTQLANYTGAIGATYSDFLSNVLTEYVGNSKGYYSRLAIVESIKAYTDFWRESARVPGLYEPKDLPSDLYTLLDFSNAVDLGHDSAGQNLLPWSDDFTNVAWTKSKVTPTPNTTTAPDGTLTAYTLTATGTLGVIYDDIASVSGSSKTDAFYVKQVPGNSQTFRVGIVFLGGTTSNRTVDILPDTMTMVTPVDGVIITAVGNGWYKVSVSNTDPIAFGNTTCRAFIYPDIFGISGSLYVWRASINEGLVPLSAHKTEGTAYNGWTLNSAIQSVDTPTNNFVILNPLVYSNSPATFSNGDLSVIPGSSTSVSATGVLYSGKRVVEMTASSVYSAIGIIDGQVADITNYPGFVANEYAYTGQGLKYNNGGSVAYGSTFALGDFIRMEIDADAQTVVMFKNGVSQGVFASGITGPMGVLIGSLSGVIPVMDINFGATDFAFTPTAGFLPWSDLNREDNDYSLSGSYTGTGRANGPYINTGATLASVTINGTTYDNDGTDSAIIIFTSTGFKLVSTTSNVSSVAYTWTGTLKYLAKTSNAQIN